MSNDLADLTPPASRETLLGGPEQRCSVDVAKEAAAGKTECPGGRFGMRSLERVECGSRLEDDVQRGSKDRVHSGHEAEVALFEGSDPIRPGGEVRHPEAAAGRGERLGNGSGPQLVRQDQDPNALEPVAERVPGHAGEDVGCGARRESDEGKGKRGRDDPRKARCTNHRHATLPAERPPPQSMKLQISLRWPADCCQLVRKQ